MTVKILDNKVKVVGGVLLIFILGVLAGSVGTGVFMKHRITRLMHGGAPMPVRVMTRMTQRLDLSAEQRGEIDRILEESRGKWIEFKSRVLPEFHESFEEDLGKIKAVLTEEQKDRLDRMYQRAKKRARFRDGGAPFMKGGHKGEILSRLKHRLDMGEEEFSRVRAIIAEGTATRRRIKRKYREQWEAGSPAMKNELEQHRKAVEERLAKILDAEQMAVYRESMERLRSFRKGMGPGPDPVR
jgi:hypothetical protein